jgi:C4-type Zn-finger protein
MKTDRKVSIAVTGSVGSNCEVSLMSQKTVHVKLRCMECKAKFDSKYDAFDTSAITNVGQVLQNFIFCQRCGKRVSVVVFDIR